MEKVTVIIPVFNAATTLHRCINSVLAQDHENWELLLVDDGSTDNSAGICMQYSTADPRIRCIQSANSGPSHARNLGIEHAKANYLCFMDADDYARHDYLSKLLQPFRGFRIQLSFSGYYEVSRRNPHPKSIHDLESLKPYDVVGASVVRQKLLYGTAGLICGKMFLTRVVREHELRFPSDLSLREDLIFILTYANHIENVAVVNDHLYYYDRSNENSLSAVRDSNFLAQSFRFVDYISDLYHDGNVSVFIREQRRGAVLSFLDATALKKLPLGRKIKTISAVCHKYSAELQAIPGDSLRIRIILCLLRAEVWVVYIIYRKLLRKLRRARGV